jgi:23S rRNA (guanine745-N1)-methyltransferase
LLQPQDRRSATPGDRREAAEARRRLYEAGHGAALLVALGAQLDRLELPTRPALLDVGCGEGSLLGALAASRPLEVHGLDLSTPAIELAARRFRRLAGSTWVVANADRFLPYAAGSFDLVLVVSARLHPDELRRVLKPQGRLLVSVPAPDDLVELRAALLGDAGRRDRLAAAVERLGGAFELEDRIGVRHEAFLGPDAVRDVVAATYRGGRRSREAQLDSMSGLRVTFAHDLARLRPR